MSESQTTRDPDELGLPDVRWHVDPAQSEVGFAVRTMWGLVNVTGRFTRYAGELEVARGVVRGALQIESASLHTGNRKRDKHLRSVDFFDVEAHPEITFALTDMTVDGEGLAIEGDLAVRDRVVHLHLPTERRIDGDRILLRTSAPLDRDRVAMTWNRMGMIQGQARLDVNLVLEPADRPT